MSSRLLRHRSRYSSPATFAEKEPAPTPADDVQMRNVHASTSSAWVEPPLRAPAPSFEDSRGLERVGVLENMQPLGTAPTHRLLQKLKLSTARPSPRATPAAQAAEGAVTPVEATEKMDFASLGMDEATTEQGLPLPDIPADALPQPDTILISSPPRGRPPRRDHGEMLQCEGMSDSAAYSSAPQSHLSPKPLSIQQQLRQDRLRSHVDRAVQEAYQRHTPDLVDGLRKIRDDAYHNPDLWNVVEAMMTNAPSPDQFKIFKRYIKKGVKRHRRQSQMSDSPYNPSPQHYHHHRAPPQPQYQSPQSSYPQIPPSNYPADFNQPIDPSLSAPQQVLSYGGGELQMSMSTAPPILPQPPLDNTLLQPENQTSHKRKRSGSASSRSSLSSVPEDVPQTWEELGTDNETTNGARSRSAGQRQATNRTSAGSRLRSAHGVPHRPSPSLQHVQLDTAGLSKTTANKRQKRIREEPGYGVDELHQRKDPFLNDSFHDYNSVPRPESNDRELVHGHPSRPTSIDLSRPPPPVVHPNRLDVSRDSLISPTSVQAPQDQIIVNAPNRRNALDESMVGELDLSSPESSPAPLHLAPPPPAAAISRGTTPRASRSQPPQKTRKSARVMVS
jgi:hypothetical protein